MNEPRIRLWYNPAALTCPDETALHDFTEGRLSGPRREAVVAHVADCEGCRLVLAALARADTHPGPDLPAQAAGPGPGPGARIDRYRILGVLGSGGMGTVYAAYDPRLRRQVALKLLHPTVAGGREAEELAARLFREAHAMARLSHPHVVAVHDVGTHGEQVFLVMEQVEGGSLRAFLEEKPRRWQEVLDVFRAAGEGLLAAHEAGLVHRDFKPDNVLIDARGQVKVSDFGLARGELRAQGDAGDGEGEAPQDEAGAGPALSEQVAERLTRTGALLGTPAYMAPEQLLSQGADARSDQFSFCTALYEALYGVRPFAGRTLMELYESILSGQVRQAPATTRAQGWLHRAVMKGLRARPEERYPDMRALLRALTPPALATRAGRIQRAVLVGLPLLLGLMYGGLRLNQRHERRLQVDVLLNDARAAVAQGRALGGESERLRRQAFARFDALDRDAGEGLWARALALSAEAVRHYDHAEKTTQAALHMDPARRDTRAFYADLLYEWALQAERDHQPAQVQDILQRLGPHDDDGGARRRRFDAPGSLALTSDPPGAQVTIAAFAGDEEGRRRLGAERALGPAPLSQVALGPGSYLLTLAAGGRANVRYPVVVARAEQLQLVVRLPPADAVPPGFVFVPAGRFLFGSTAEETLRKGFFGTVPLHEVRTSAYLIQKTETTWAEWLAYLRALPDAERARRTPRVATVGFHGALELRERPPGTFWLTIQPATRAYTAREGARITYGRRTRRQSVDWLRLPVTGIDWDDAQAYVAWLGRGRVPGARLCTEYEWERAARGADDREFPHGDRLEPDDANFDATYGKDPLGFGPDEAGSHPASRSPFEIDDLAGNAWEWVRSSLARDEPVVRGGSYYFDQNVERSPNRQVPEPSMRDLTQGLRVCATPADQYL